MHAQENTSITISVCTIIPSVYPILENTKNIQQRKTHHLNMERESRGGEESRRLELIEEEKNNKAKKSVCIGGKHKKTLTNKSSAQTNR